MESGWFFLWIAVIGQRLLELRKAKKNALWMKTQGGYEVGKKHYPLIVAIHILFFAGIWIESIWFDAKPPKWWLIPLILFLLAQGLRLWCMKSLGRYWNTRIWVIPGHVPQIHGPYRYLRHPNYLAVILEMFLFPLVFGTYFTAVWITILNIWVLRFLRIPYEEKALLEVMSYEESMGGKKRFLPMFSASVPISEMYNRKDFVHREYETPIEPVSSPQGTQEKRYPL
jgi:methyltransferase